MNEQQLLDTIYATGFQKHGIYKTTKSDHSFLNPTTGKIYRSYKSGLVRCSSPTIKNPYTSEKYFNSILNKQIRNGYTTYVLLPTVEQRLEKILKIATRLNTAK